MGGVVELLDVECVVLRVGQAYLELDDSSFVIVDIAVVGSREDGDDDWEVSGSIPAMHLVPI